MAASDAIQEEVAVIDNQTPQQSTEADRKKYVVVLSLLIAVLAVLFIIYWLPAVSNLPTP